MPALTKGSLSVYPAAICEGRKAQEQAVLCWLYHEVLCGNEWSAASISRQAGITAPTVTACLSIFVQEGLLREVPE